MKDDDTPDAFRRSAAADLLSAVAAESKIAAFKILGARRLKDQIRQTSQAIVRPVPKNDARAFSVAKGQALLEFSAALATMTSEAIVEMKSAQLVQTKLLMARIEQVEAAFESELTQLRPLLNRLREQEDI